MKKKAAVIGAGFGGLAAALRARSKGYDVTIFEKGQQLGGRARVFKRGGFKHDAGPTVITAPWLLEELFQLFGKNIKDYVELRKLDLWYRFVYPDGSSFDYTRDIQKTLAQIQNLSPVDVQGYQNLLKDSEKIFNVGFDQLSAKPFHNLFFMLRQVPAMIRLRAHRTVWQFVASHLKHEKLRQAFSIQPLLVGGNPFDTTSIYSLIHFLERKWGIYFPMGGTGSLVAALGKLALEEGISIRLQTEIKNIKAANKKVVSIETRKGEIVPCDILISNGDPKITYNTINHNKYSKNWKVKLREKYSKYSMALFVLFFGTKKQYANVAHHTIWFGKRYKELLSEIFHGNKLPEDFSLYIHRPTATDPSFAPKDCDSFYVLSPVPNLKADIDWKIQGAEYASTIIDSLNDTILPNLKDNIVESFFMTPEDFKKDYISEYGAGFSIAPVFYQSAWFRYHNKAEGIKNLYLVGAGTHPGAGLPGVLCSAKVVDSIL